MNTPPRTLPVLFLVVLILFIAASLKHTSTSTTSPLVGHPNKKTSANSSKPQTPWSLERLKPQFPGGVRQRVEKAEAIWKKTVEQRHKMLEDYTDPNNKDMSVYSHKLRKILQLTAHARFPARGAANYAVTPFTIWDFIPASFNCPYEIERIGRLGDGGKWVCGLSRYEKTSKPCIVYSFGIQQESSFEEELLERTKCELWGYDPTVDDFGPQLKSKMKGQGRATFTKAGISGKTDKTQQPPFYSIADLIEMNGHSHVDILKMDIEGFEFEALTSMVEDFQKQDVPISQILIEIHLDVGRKTVDQFLEWWESLETAGYRAAWTEPNLLTVSLPLGDGMPRFAEYSLINVKDGQNLLLS